MVKMNEQRLPRVRRGQGGGELLYKGRRAFAGYDEKTFWVQIGVMVISTVNVFMPWSCM